MDSKTRKGTKLSLRRAPVRRPARGNEGFPEPMLLSDISGGIHLRTGLPAKVEEAGLGQLKSTTRGRKMERVQPTFSNEVIASSKNFSRRDSKPRKKYRTPVSGGIIVEVAVRGRESGSGKWDATGGKESMRKEGEEGPLERLLGDGGRIRGHQIPSSASQTLCREKSVKDLEVKGGKGGRRSLRSACENERAQLFPPSFLSSYPQPTTNPNFSICPSPTLPISPLSPWS